MPTSVRKSSSLLLIDDDAKLCSLMRDYLEPQGFVLTIRADGVSGLHSALEQEFDAVLLDMMLPDMDGLEVLRRLRQAKTTPVIILSAQDEEASRIVGLEMGADDYVPKTFSPRELLARIRAVVRRTAPVVEASSELADATLTVRGLSLNAQTLEAHIDGRLVELTTLEFRILYGMASQPGRVFTRENLLELAVGRDFNRYDRSVDMHISTLRRKIGEDPREPAYIKTVRGMGYTLVK